MIFVTLGTHHQPFLRALDLIAPLAEIDEVVAQLGPTPARDNHRLATFPFISFPEMRRYIEEADVVVCHAGVGTIITAIEFGHRPVVIPRLRAYNEHVDDHQFQLASRLSDRGLVLGYTPDASLSALVEDARARRDLALPASAELGRALAADIDATCRSNAWPRPPLWARPSRHFSGTRWPRVTRGSVH